MRRKSAIFGVLLLSCGSVALSCSSNNDDPVSRACGVIVGHCHVMPDMGDCLDAVGTIDSPDCVACIAANMACDYAINCPRMLPQDECNFPASIVPKGERALLDAGPPPATSGDAGQ
jgi:hypothetical protein